MKRAIEKLREEYENLPIDEEQLAADPLTQCTRWLGEAIDAQVKEPNGMTLATSTSGGRCSARTVLLKGIDDKGFLFYSHYPSRKGEQLEESPHAALLFWWRELYRQVSIEGTVSKISRKQSRAYFATRPRGAQLAALATHQSAPIASRAEIEESFFRLQTKYRGKPVPCPTTWGGYRLVPDRVEFWQGRKDRLHDRFVYVHQDGAWLLTRLAP